MRYTLCALLVLAGAPCVAFAQQDEPAEAAEEEQPAGDPDSISTDTTQFRVYEAPDETAEGDAVVLRDGRRLENVQVLRRTSSGYEIEIVEGAPPMLLPREMITDIEWDDYNPGEPNIADLSGEFGGEEAAEGENGSGKVELLPKVNVPTQLAAKLRKDITSDLTMLSGKGLFDVLKKVETAAQLKITVDKPLRELANKEREPKVHVDLKDDSSVRVVDFFHKYLLKQPAMRKVAVVYRPDQVVFTTKEAAKKLEKQEADVNEPAEAEAKETASASP